LAGSSTDSSQPISSLLFFASLFTFMDAVFAEMTLFLLSLNGKSGNAKDFPGSKVGPSKQCRYFSLLNSQVTSSLQRITVIRWRWPIRRVCNNYFNGLFCQIGIRYFSERNDLIRVQLWLLS
jgi:hypothetical protein